MDAGGRCGAISADVCARAAWPTRVTDATEQRFRGRQTIPKCPSGARRALALTYLRARADLASEARRTYAGFLWWLIEPLLATGVYYLVMGGLVGHLGKEFVPFLLAGVLPWRWTSTCIMTGSQVVLGSRGLILQARFPFVALPLSAVLEGLVKFAFAFALLCVLPLAGRLNPGVALVGVPALVLVQLVFNAGLTAVTAFLVPFVPDMRNVLGSCLRLWFFVSGIFYGAQHVPAAFRTYLRLNPMFTLVEGYRAVLLDGVLPDLANLALILAQGILFLGAGVWLSVRFAHVYPRVAS
jgi:homopolymeric O-antigen transport system permease protein